MSFQLDDIFPNLPQGLSNIGFLLGAGASRKAGYPLMPELTTQVLGGLKSEENELINVLIEKSLGKPLDKIKGEPNIEIISDVLEGAILTADVKNKNYQHMFELRSFIRNHIVDVLLSINNPNLDDHIKFFTALNRLLYGRTEQVWIFTPNYEMLFEIACSIAHLPLSDGFIGSSMRFFNVSSLLFQSGFIEGHSFKPFNQPTIRLVKLHGSLDWWKNNGKIYSTSDPHKLQGKSDRLIVLPRKKKITETLDPPFNDLFRISERILGTKCKYLVSCGYGFADQHINEILLLPKLQQLKITLTAFLKEDSANLDTFRSLPSFAFGTETISKKRNNSVESTGTDLWKFENLVNLISKSAGI
jgi:hypothetical protein